MVSGAKIGRGGGYPVLEPPCPALRRGEMVSDTNLPSSEPARVVFNTFFSFLMSNFRNPLGVGDMEGGWCPRGVVKRG